LVSLDTRQAWADRSPMGRYRQGRPGLRDRGCYCAFLIDPFQQRRGWHEFHRKPSWENCPPEQGMVLVVSFGSSLAECSLACNAPNREGESLLNAPEVVTHGKLIKYGMDR